MMHRTLLLLALFVLASPSAYGQGRTIYKPTDPKAFIAWDPAKVNEVADRLYREIGDKNILFETLVNTEGHSAYLVLRAKTADAEFHETEEDIYIVVRGHGTLVFGGEMVNPEDRPRKQKRAASIKGGTRTDMRPGAILHVPRAVPHQILVAPGEKFLYWLFKLDEYPLENLNPHDLVPETKPR